MWVHNSNRQNFHVDEDSRRLLKEKVVGEGSFLVRTTPCKSLEFEGIPTAVGGVRTVR